MLRRLCRLFHAGTGVDLPPPAQRCEARGGAAGASRDAKKHRVERRKEKEAAE